MNDRVVGCRLSVGGRGGRRRTDNGLNSLSRAGRVTPEEEERIAELVSATLFPLRFAGAAVLASGMLWVFISGTEIGSRLWAGREVHVEAFGVLGLSILWSGLGVALLARGVRARAHPLFALFALHGRDVETVRFVGALHRSFTYVFVGARGGAERQLVFRGPEGDARALFAKVAPSARDVGPLDRRAPVTQSLAQTPVPGPDEVATLIALVDTQIAPDRHVGMMQACALPLGATACALEWSDADWAWPPPDTALVALAIGAALGGLGLRGWYRNRRADAHPMFDAIVTRRAEISHIEVARVLNSWADNLVVRTPASATPVKLFVRHEDRDAIVAILVGAARVEPTYSDAIRRP